MIDAEALLDSMTPIGWSLGLGRMQALCDELGRPQDRFESIHVVGTNGKSSVARMCAAIAGAHGTRAGCSVSPHLDRWSERVVIGGHEIPSEDFAAAVERTAGAAEAVNRMPTHEGVVTQFELATAAAFLALAGAGVEVAAIEAGLGGRLDASNTINSKVTALTSIGLDHTEYLGRTESAIAGEKLAVLRPGTTLVLGPVDPVVEQLAERVAAEEGCRLIRAGWEESGCADDSVRAEGPGDGSGRSATADGPAGPPEGGFRMASPGGFQRQNFAVARAATGACMGELDPELVAAAAAAVVVPGRLERIGENPPVYVDVAHNPAGAAALLRALPEVSGGRPVFALIGVPNDKDAAGILAELAPGLRQAVFTELPEESLAKRGRPGVRSRSAAELLHLANEAGLAGEACPDPGEGFFRVRRMAGEAGGMVLVAGSHFLISPVKPG